MIFERRRRPTRERPDFPVFPLYPPFLFLFHASPSPRQRLMRREVQLLEMLGVKEGKKDKMILTGDYNLNVVVIRLLDVG